MLSKSTLEANTKPKSKLLGLVALVGNPNTGKSSLFNALCGMNAKVGNFPGVTVEKKTGQWKAVDGSHIEVVDLPGTYSLAARSADESIAVEVLLGKSTKIAGHAHTSTSDVPSDLEPQPDCVIVVVDAAAIERNLYLFSQVRELGLPTLLVLNMWDRVATDCDLTIDIPKLAETLSVPVLTAVASKRQGIKEIQCKVEEMLAGRVTNQHPADQSVGSKQHSSSAQPDIYPPLFLEETKGLQDWLLARGHAVHRFEVSRLLIDAGGPIESYWKHVLGTSSHSDTKTTNVSGENSEVADGLDSKLQGIRAKLKEADLSVPRMEPKLRHAWIKSTIKDAVHRAALPVVTFSDRIDRLLTHQVWGLLSLVAVLFFVFQAVFASIGTGWLSEQIDFGCETLALLVSSTIPPGALRSLLNDGVIAGVGGVLVFIPQIAVLFLLIAILEDCGYMARVALVMDRWMSMLGLSGRAFLPLMTSFGCAVPGIMSARTIASRRDRMVAILVAPLMSCSARLPVYTLMITTFIPSVSYVNGWVSLQGLLFLAMYSLGAIVAIPIAWLLKKFAFPGPTSPFVLEMPSYKWPSWRVVLSQVWEQVRSFAVRAGTLIFCTSILLWAAAYFPSDHREENQLVAKLEAIDAQAPQPASVSTSDVHVEAISMRINKLRATSIEQSFLGRFGRSIEPVFHAVGWDWKIGVGVIASFPAREVIIATLGTIYSLGSDVDEGSESLAEQLRASKWPDGRPVFTWVTALSIMVFFALCAQCAATLVAIKRETKTWFWPVFTFVYMTALAYFSAMLVFVVGSQF
ncbi:MAG: ferrous iron transport protein B [Planctomycetota bacterium]|nr:ferrous iron transport protein B [Planctomycetota bacterium]